MPPILNPVDGTIQRPDPRGGSYDYLVLSDPDPDGSQLGEIPPTWPTASTFSSISQSLKASLRPIAKSVVASITEAGEQGTIVAPAPWSRTCANPDCSTTRSGWSQDDPSSTRSRTS